MIFQKHRNTGTVIVSETKLCNGIVIRVEQQHETLHRVSVLLARPLEEYSAIGSRLEADILSRHLKEKYSSLSYPFLSTD